jgi:beta-glucanase (GH16 family)
VLPNRGPKQPAHAGGPAIPRAGRLDGRWRRGAVLLLTGLALATGTVASAPARAAHTAAVVVTERIGTPGVYRVTITISSHSRRADHVRVLVGSVARDAITSGDRGLTRISLQIHIEGHTLTIRAIGRRSRPHIAISLRHLARSSVGKPPKTTGSAGTTAPAPSSLAPPAGDPGNWHLLFDDEFSGTSLNTAKWSAGWFGSGITQPLTPAELECFDPAQVSVGSGELDLSMIAKPESCGGKTRPYASGIVTTNGKFSYTYGFMEARVWVPGTGGVIPDWPDVWTDGHNWPADGEIDIMEGLSGQACWHFHYPGGGPGDCSNASFTGGWHTFGADWEPGVITYYYDGTRVGTIKSAVTGAPMYLILSLAADTVNGGPVKPATIRFDYVHVWQH